MHPYSLIPLAALLVSAAFAAVALAWNSDRRATRSMAAFFACTGAWALIELLASGETQPARALGWLRWVHLPPLLIGPAVVWVAATIAPRPRPDLMTTARVGTLVAAGLGSFAAWHPDAVVAVRSTPVGWLPVYGTLSKGLIPLSTLLPIYAGLVTRQGAPVDPVREPADPGRVRAMRWGVAISVLVVASTEYVLPLADVAFPRLGALASALCVAVLWLRALHQSDDLSVTPQGVARSVLARLHDGVLLVDLEGRILSSNQRFADMVGAERSTVVSSRLSDWIELEVAQDLSELEDHACCLRRTGGGQLAASLTTSAAKDASGAPVGTVVVVRDRREVDALRTRLLESGRLAAVGELAAGIAHEINNPIAFVRSDLNLLSRRLDEIEHRAAKVPDGELELAVLARSRRRISVALEGVDRVAQIVGDVRDFAHAGGASQGGSEPEVVVEAALRFARLARGDEVEMRIVKITGEGRIENGQELKQILVGLLRAAAIGLERGASIDVELGVLPDAVEIELTAGPLHQSAADPFEAIGDDRRPAGAGSDGLGLSSAVELLEGIGGRLERRDSEPGRIAARLVVPTAGGLVS